MEGRRGELRGEGRRQLTENVKVLAKEENKGRVERKEGSKRGEEGRKREEEERKRGGNGRKEGT